MPPFWHRSAGQTTENPPRSKGRPSNAMHLGAIDVRDITRTTKLPSGREDELLRVYEGVTLTEDVFVLTVMQKRFSATHALSASGRIAVYHAA